LGRTGVHCCALPKLGGHTEFEPVTRGAKSP